MKPSKRLLLLGLFLLRMPVAFSQPGTDSKGVGVAADADWQWSLPVNGGRSNAGPARSFLWIPPNCNYVRGVVVAQNNMEEISILENPVFRRNMAALGFAEIWVSPAFDPFFNFQKEAGEVLTSLINELAQESGYPELAVAPIVGIGHSAAASWPYYLAAWKPERVLAAISVSGQWPYARLEPFAPDIWGTRTIDYVPALESMGEYETAATWSAEGLKERQLHPLMPLSMLACPAEGHFATTATKCDYLAFYIKKAAQYRLPENTPTGQVPKLKPVDPTKSGWLADKWRPDQQPMAPAAPVGKYTGDPAQAFWFFDEETVRMTEKYQSMHRNKKAPLLGYVQQGAVVPQRDTHQQVDLTFAPLPDGLTFSLKGAFLDRVPGQSPRPAMWTGKPAGSPVGHPAGGVIGVNKIAGPFQKLTDSTFVLRLERGLGETLKSYDCWFTATYPGDADYKPAVQQARMVVPRQHTDGVVQRITFPEIPAQKAGVKQLRLQAMSDAGLPIYYYVLAGPAVVSGNVLTFTKIPLRATFPVRVTVVAWQYGIAGSVQTAESVTRHFRLEK